MRQNQQSQPLSDQQIFAIAGILAVLAFIVTLGKYLPMILLGVVVGRVLFAGARTGSGLQRVKTATYGLIFYALILYGLLACPFYSSSAQFPGVLNYLDSFWDFTGFVLREWNAHIPTWPQGAHRMMWVNIDQVTLRDISYYGWVSLMSASGVLVLSAAWEFWKVLNPDGKIEVNRANGFDHAARFPARFVSRLVGFIFLGWVNVGHEIAYELRQWKWVETILVSGVCGLLASAALLINAYLVPRIPFKDVQLILSYILQGPITGLGLGFVIGMIPFGVGDKLLGAAFGSHIKEKVQVKGGFTLGVDSHGRNHTLTERNLSYHVEIITPTGGGKTNLLKNLISDRIHRGHGIVFIDLKADFQVVSWLMRTATAAGRAGELRLLSLANRELSVPYNPIKLGSAPEIHSQLMNSMTWSEDYYRKISSIALMTLLRGLTEYRDRTGEFFHLGHLHDLLNEPGLLRALGGKLSAMNCPASRDVGLLCEKLDRPSERDKLTGLVANLGLLIHSAAGPLISADVRNGSFDFREAVDEGRITYVLMNSMKLRETASVFGKMILQDLMRLAGDRYADTEGGKQHRPVTLVIDEFAAFAIPEFIEFMDRARGAGIGIVFAHQSRADLRAVSPEFQERCESNSNTVIVSGVKSSADAEYFAGMLGTRTVVKETRQVAPSFFGEGATGNKSVRDVEEYVLHPNILKDLHQGEAFTVSRTVDPRWAVVRIPEAREFTGVEMPAAALNTHLTQIRKCYMESAKDKYLDLNALAKTTDVTTDVTTVDDVSKPELWS